MAVGSGFLGLSKVPAAQLNPMLIRSYAAALAPFFGDLVGGQQQAFDTVRTQVLADPSALRNLLSVLVADPEAGERPSKRCALPPNGTRTPPLRRRRKVTSQSPISPRRGRY